VEITFSGKTELMRTKFLIVFFLASIVFTTGYFVTRTKSAKEVTYGASSFALSKDELEVLQSKAKAGDCDAAYRIAKFHSYVTLQYEDSIMSSRLAVRCPGVRPKELLVAMLFTRADVDSIVGEVESLIFDMGKTDPEAADRARRELTRVRDIKNKTK
jgi:hypothetical protein